MTFSDNDPKQLKISQNHSQVTKAANATEKTTKIDIFQCWYVVMKSQSQNTKSDAMPNT